MLEDIPLQDLPRESSTRRPEVAVHGGIIEAAEVEQGLAETLVDFFFSVGQVVWGGFGLGQLF